MLNNPREGIKKVTRARILLVDEKNPQEIMRKEDVNGTKYFFLLINFKCSVEQVFKDIAIDNPRIVRGSM